MARFEKWGFVSLPYFHSETNEWLKDWAKWRVQHWSVTRSCEIHWNSYFTSWHGKVVSVTQWLVTGSLPKIYNKPFLTLKISQYSKSGGTSSSSKPLAVSSNCSWLGKTLYLGCLSCSAGVLTPELTFDFAGKSFDCLESGLAFWSNG